MTDGESFIVERRDHPDLNQIILAENKDALAQFLDEPLTAIVESITGALAAGPKAWSASAGRLVQGALKAKLFEQLSREIKDLKDKGKTPDDFAEKRNGFQSWVELMTIIDEESPDPERLAALKAMFYAVNRVNAEDAERILSYQLFQIAKKLTAGQLLYLKVCYEIYRKQEFPRNFGRFDEWLTVAAQRLGHNVLSLIRLDDQALAELGLVDNNNLGVRNTNLSDLGIKFCEEMQKYHLEALERPGSES